MLIVYVFDVFICDSCDKYGLYYFRAEQTYEYTPPEALLNATWYQGPTSSTLKYVIFCMN